MNLVSKARIIEHLKRAEGASEVTLPIEFFRDLLYQAMPKEWIGLTYDEFNTAFDDTQEGGGFKEFAEAIEAILKRKNT
jgi:hypothetical protein